MNLYGGVEAGGTKFVCVIAGGPEDIRAEVKFPTTQPQETIGRVIAFFKENRVKYKDPLVSIGVACFGPIDLELASAKYGYITTTPKPGWPDTDVVGTLGKNLDLPVAIDTDVNAAAVGEGVWGAGQGLEDFVYLTIGTGIGGGGLSNGRPIHGLVHPEMGHMRLPHNWQDDPFPGSCIYHGDCLEGMASGPALQKRWGQPAETFRIDHKIWDLESTYLALAVQNLVCTLSPRRVILGGGVMQQSHLFPLIRAKTKIFLNNYIAAPEILEDVDHFIVPPGLGNRAGVLGAVALAKQIAARM
ncbi:MAG: ROK family protein [Anaerolineaceae bacterium]